MGLVGGRVELAYRLGGADLEVLRIRSEVRRGEGGGARVEGTLVFYICKYVIINNYIHKIIIITYHLFCIDAGQEPIIYIYTYTYTIYRVYIEGLLSFLYT